jgi:nucleotide-binding universal stress UspA family protein
MSERPCIVVGYDGSPTARRAFEFAAERAGPDGRVVVAYAFEPPHDWLGHPNYNRVLVEHRTRGQQMLDEIPDSPGLDKELLAGPPAEALVRVASAHEADEIVVGSRGFGSMRAALGSVSHALLHLADRPVVVIPPDRGAADPG